MAGRSLAASCSTTTASGAAIAFGIKREIAKEITETQAFIIVVRLLTLPYDIWIS
jgi:hypothetical protein